MKKYFVLLFVTLVISFSIFIFLKPKPSSFTTSEDAKTWILSDTHFISPDLYDDGSAFQSMQETAAGKDLLHQENSWQALLEQAKQGHPDFLIITGDLTFNGEYLSAEDFQRYFAQFEAIGTRVLVIPGNHDIHDGWARKFEGNQQVIAKQISPHAFRKLFASSYEQALAKDENSLSYVVQGTANVRFFLLDTNIYPFETSRHQPATGGEIKEATLQWLDTQLKAAQEAKQTPIIFMHHNLFKHNEEVYKGYVLNHAEEVQALFQKYQVPLVFSGHIHAQDILQEQKIVEVTTGAFSIAPQSIGELQLTKNKWHYTRQTLNTSQQVAPDGFPSYEAYLEDFLYQDGKHFAYGQMIDRGIYDSKQLDQVADVVGQAHLRYFTGEDDLSDAEIKQFQASPGYQLLEHLELGSLLSYLQSIQQDTNLPDTHFTFVRENAEWQLMK